ncbi:MAG: ATP-binding protein [Sedimentisphaerales bacterium]|jgi:PAS domain S-box-containing protein
MTIFRNMTIKYKLMTIVIAACTAGLLLAGVAFLGWERNSIRNNMVKVLATRAEILGENCKASLTFQDSKDAEKILQALHVDSSMISGSIYNGNNELFATYYRDKNKSIVTPTEFKKASVTFSNDSLIVFAPIILDNEIIGTICLQSDLNNIHESLNRGVLIIITVIIISLLAVFLVSSRLQAVISGPILSLASVAKAVSEKKDYAVRAVKTSSDEIGLLIDAFNEMLGEIQERDLELQDAKLGLEVKVEERTVELSKANEQMTKEITDRRKAQEDLTQLLSLHTATLESTADGILVVDLNGKVISYNQKFLQLWQISESVAATKNDEKILASVLEQLANPEKFISEVKRLYANPLASSLDILEFKDSRVYERCSQPQRIDNKVVGRVWSYRDITDRKIAEQALKESKQMLQLVMNNIPQYIFWKDKNSVYLGGNTNFAKAKGFSKPEEIFGKTDKDLVWNKEEADLYRECDLKIMDSNTPQYHIIEQQKQADGKEAWIDTSKIPLHDVNGNVVGILGSYENITDRKKAEEEKEKLNHELEEANQEMKNFVYIASHDLREPLRKVAAFGDMLQKSLGGKLEQEDAENLQFMIDGAQRMNKMIEGLLVYSRVSTKSNPPEVVDLNEIVKQLQQLELSIVLQEKQVAVEIPEPLPSVAADPVQIRQLMQNLIANGIKYQAKDNIPRITITSKSAGNGTVRINVTDNGIGIKPEYQSAIFVMFKRLHSRNEYEGTGIGLAVCKKIVERHGGQIGIESEYGKGCTFWFTMPVAVTAEVAGNKINV